MSKRPKRILEIETGFEIPDIDMGPDPIPFKEEYIELARNYCSLGANGSDVARFLGVSLSTFESWRKQNKDFNDAVVSGRDYFMTEKVESSLYMLATGYQIEEEKSWCNTSTGEIYTHSSTTHVKPNERAIEFVLRCRKPDRWNPTDKTDNNHNFSGPSKIMFGDTSEK